MERRERMSLGPYDGLDHHLETLAMKRMGKSGIYIACAMSAALSLGGCAVTDSDWQMIGAALDTYSCANAGVCRTYPTTTPSRQKPDQPGLKNCRTRSGHTYQATTCELAG